MSHEPPKPVPILCKLVAEAWEAAGQPSYQELGARARVHPVTIGKWIRGTRSPDPDEAARVLAALGYELLVAPTDQKARQRWVESLLKKK